MRIGTGLPGETAIDNVTFDPSVPAMPCPVGAAALAATANPSAAMATRELAHRRR
jgi:hypothetical protein